MALAIGSIMAVVAVLLSHMDRKDDVNIMPRMSLEKGESCYFHWILLVPLGEKGKKIFVVFFNQT